MKYYRFHEPDSGEGEYLHYLAPHEARVLIDVHFIRPGQISKTNAMNYRQRYSRDVEDDYSMFMSREGIDSTLTDDFVIRCLEVFGFTQIKVIESSKELAPIYKFDAGLQEWIPDTK